MTARRCVFLGLYILALLAAPFAVHAQQTRVYRVGVLLQGGAYWEAVEGLRDGLKELGLEDGRQFFLKVHDAKGDLKSIQPAARGFEGEKVDVIYSVAASVTLETKRATHNVPMVFYAGTDPVAFGLVASLRNPGGRLTGIHGRFTDLAAKRLQLLKEMLPRLRRVITFYNPDNRAAQESIKIGRDAARRLKVELVERHVASVEELRAALRAIRPGEADAFFYVADAMMTSQAELIVNAAMAKGLPAMFADKDSAAKGALASYGVSFYTIGRLSARHIQRVLLGANPGDLPVEQVDRLHFVINLKTAKALGLSLPSSVIARADEVIQ